MVGNGGLRELIGVLALALDSTCVLVGTPISAGHMTFDQSRKYAL